MARIRINGVEYNISGMILPEKYNGKALVMVQGLTITGETADWMDENDDFHGRKFSAHAAVTISDVKKGAKDAIVLAYSKEPIDGGTYIDARYGEIRGEITDSRINPQREPEDVGDWYGRNFGADPFF